ncbi:MAG: FtsW/RodA/SpoVE family cell cycle protein, partial [Petrimonas sp.]|nr:FtsW/RodA/SpoVE family cell cycle protein [Petrimonas sp.]
MLDKIKNAFDQNNFQEDLENSKSTIGRLGVKIFKGDKVVWLVFVILCVISLVEIFSATSTIVYKQQNQWGPILRHTMFLIGGVGVIILIHNIP